MISFDQAKELAIRKIGPRCGLIEESTIEKSYGWYFLFQSKEWLKSRDWRHALVGSGGFIVERADGRIYEFGSAYSLERNFAAYEYGLKYQLYDMVVTRIHQFETTLDLLLTLDLTYVIPEFAHGRLWRIPIPYDRKQLADNLQSLPCTFPDCRGFYFKYEQFLELDRARCCEYELHGHPDERAPKS
jgi:hypothetical protein